MNPSFFTNSSQPISIVESMETAMDYSGTEATRHNKDIEAIERLPHVGGHSLQSRYVFYLLTII